MLLDEGENYNCLELLGFEYIPLKPHLKVFLVSLKHDFHFNPVETFCKIGKKMPFGLILALFGAKRGPQIWPTGAIFYTRLEVHTICL